MNLFTPTWEYSHCHQKKIVYIFRSSSKKTETCNNYSKCKYCRIFPPLTSQRIKTWISVIVTTNLSNLISCGCVARSLKLVIKKQRWFSAAAWRMKNKRPHRAHINILFICCRNCPSSSQLFQPKRRPRPSAIRPYTRIHIHRFFSIFC